MLIPAKNIYLYVTIILRHPIEIETESSYCHFCIEKDVVNIEKRFCNEYMKIWRIYYEFMDDHLLYIMDFEDLPPVS